jgi:3-hydroxyacyl-[acyl-carrier-protein] dehydratase
MRRSIRCRRAMNEERTGLPLPHRYPFLLLDRVIHVRSGVSAEAIKNLARADSLLDADGRLPAVLLAEAMAQCAGLALLAMRPHTGAVLARIDRFRTTRAAVVAGDQLRVFAQVQRIFGATVKARGMVRVAGRIRAAAELVLHMSSGEGANG